MTLIMEAAMGTISPNEKITILEKSRNRLREEMVVIEQEFHEKEASLKNLTLLLVSLAHDPNQPQRNTYLEALKTTIKSEIKTDQINDIALKLKTNLLSHEHVKGTAKKPYRTKKISGSSKGMTVFEVLNKITFKLKMIGDNELKKELEMLQNEMRKSFSPTAVPEYIEKITVVVQEFKDRLYKVRPAIESFVDELVESLIKTEAEIKNMSATHEEKHQSDIRFNDTLESELKTMEKTLLLAEDLKKIKDPVFEKLTNITNRINQKRAIDKKIYRLIQKRFTAMEQQIDAARKEAQLMEKKSQDFFRLSLYDELTGVFNRKGYEEEFNKQWNIFKRYGIIFALAVFDIDDFKAINDTYGHKAGDIVLQKVAKDAKKVFRNVDIPARYGGDEFIVILPNTSLKQAMISAERMRKLIESADLRYWGQTVKEKVTISIGVAAVNKTDTPETFFERADRALYKAKKSGKNQTQSAKSIQ